MANSADPDQLASEEANWSGSPLFAKAGYIRFSRTRVKTQIILKNTHPLSEGNIFLKDFVKLFDFAIQ